MLLTSDRDVQCLTPTRSRVQHMNVQCFIAQSLSFPSLLYIVLRGWSGGAKVLCISRHWGVQLILARPAILVAGKGSEGMFLSHLLVAGCDIGVRFSVRPSVSPSVSPSVRLSTFMSTFDIYVKVSILINYKTKQPSNLA